MSWVQGFLIAVPEANKETYREMAESAWPFFERYGALRMVETWGADLSRRDEGIDFHQAVDAGPGQNVVFSWVVWPDKETCDEAARQMESDPEMKMPDDCPFDPKQMIYGGFEVLVDVGSED